MFAETGLSGFTSVMFADAQKIPSLGDLSEQLAKAEADFQKLCAAAPLVPKEAIRGISMSYATIAFCFDKPETMPSQLESIRVVIAAAKTLGMALGMIAQSPYTETEKRRAALSAAGSSGAKARHKKPRDLKQWALTQAAHMRGDDAGIARKLASILPPQHADVSRNPERLIYDTLRAARKIPKR